MEKLQYDLYYIKNMSLLLDLAISFETAFARGDVQLDRTPGRARQGDDLLQDGGGSAAERDQGDAHGIQATQAGIGDPPGVEDQMLGENAPVSLFPEGDEAEDLLLLAFAQIGVGVAQGPAGAVLGQENENAGLAATAGRDIVALDDRILSVARDGVEVEIERCPGQRIRARQQLVPSGRQANDPLVIDPGRVLGQVTLLGVDVQSGKEAQLLVGHQRHDVALALDRPDFKARHERSARAMPLTARPNCWRNGKFRACCFMRDSAPPWRSNRRRDRGHARRRFGS